MALKQLVSLDRPQLEQLASVLREKLPCARAPLSKAVAKQLKLDSNEANGLVETLASYLIKAIPGGSLHNKAWSTLLKDVKSAKNLLDAGTLAELEANKDLYEVILSESNAIALKGSLLQQLVVPHVAGLETLVELRPIFDENHDEVLAFVPVVLLQLNLHASGCEDLSAHCFQLSSDSLKRMIQTLVDADKKLTVLSSSVAHANLRVLG